MKIIEVLNRELHLNESEIRILKRILPYVLHRLEKHDSKGLQWLRSTECLAFIRKFMKDVG